MNKVYEDYKAAIKAYQDMKEEVTGNILRACQQMKPGDEFTVGQMADAVELPWQSIPGMLWGTYPIMRREKRTVTQTYALIRDDGSVDTKRTITVRSPRVYYVRDSAPARDLNLHHSIPENADGSEILAALGLGTPATDNPGASIGGEMVRRMIEAYEKGMN